MMTNSQTTKGQKVQNDKYSAEANSKKEGDDEPSVHTAKINADRTLPAQTGGMRGEGEQR
jgi:hypothetical protein